MDTKFVLQEKINVKNRPAISTKTITSTCPLCNPRATTNKNNVILTLLPLLQYYIILKSVLEQIRSGLGLTQMYLLLHIGRKV
jgi:hypothetical protein